MGFYLQISKALIALFLSTSPNHWVMEPIPTTYVKHNGDTIYVVERRWVDTLLQGIILDTTITWPIDTTLDDLSINVVRLPDSVIVH